MSYTPPGHDRDAPDEFEAIPPGIYGCVVEALELKYSQEHGNAYINWTFVVAEGEQKNRRLWNVASLLPKSVNMPGGWYKSIKAAMNDGGDYAEEVSKTSYDTEEDMAEIVAEVVCGRMVTLAVAQRIFEGRKQANVTAIKAYEGDLPQLSMDEMEETKGSNKRPKTGKKAGKPAKKAKKTSKDDF
ncbi:hypothetical protein LCGC14_2305300 [marine sediment metagenome]|uniref:DUF669 domain-containing protein n=1 Tax=marine sediment metagenome TaxID=412755 RepID=A0A0F9CMQ5_9ZZZZ